MFLEKSVLKICSKLTAEYPCRIAIPIKFQSNFIKVTLRHGCSPVNLLHIFRTPFLKNTSEGLFLNITLITFVFETVNSNICRFQWLVNIFLNITFAVQYFNQKTSNGTPKSYFLPGNIQDSTNTFDRNWIDLFVKFYTHERPWNVQSNTVYCSI